MNCHDFDQRLDDHLDGLLDATARAALQDHLQGCERCRARLAGAQRLGTALRELPVPPLSPGFAERALRKAAEGSRHHRRGFVAGFGSALAAGLALWLMAGVWFTDSGVQQESFPELTIALYQTRNVNLVFSAPDSLSEATFSIELPPDLELEGYPGQRAITWQAPLAKGNNVLSLPLRATGPAGGSLLATISHGEKRKSFRVEVTVRDGSPTGMPAQATPLA